MDELKLILEAGDNAKEAAYAYFAVCLIGKVLLFTGIMIAVTLAYRLCHTALASEGAEAEIERLGEILGTKKAGYFRDHERKATYEMLHKLAKEKS